jgi:hypothetical protein
MNMKASRPGSKRWISSSLLALTLGAAPWVRAERTPVRSVPSPAILPDGLTDADIEAFVDKRFFAGGDYFVDTAEHPARGK